jgi:aspartate kinase
VPARSFLGHQIRIATDSAYGRARITRVDVDRLRESITRMKVAVVAGFQGVDDTATSRRSAAAARTRAAWRWPPRSTPTCARSTPTWTASTRATRASSRRRASSPRIAYDEMLELASLGAKVLQIRSVEFAKRYRVPVHVRSSFNEEEGRGSSRRTRPWRRCRSPASRTTATRPSSPCCACPTARARRQLLGPIARANIVVDMIIQNASADGTTDVTFTVPRGDYQKAKSLVDATAREIGAQGVTGETDVAKVSIVGVGMRTHAGIAARMFEVLAAEGINIQMISTSEIKISVVIDEKYTELAVRTLHDALVTKRP